MRTCRRRCRWYSRRRYTGRGVVGINNSLRDIGRTRLCPKHRQTALLAGVIQKHGVAVVLHILDYDRPQLLRDGTERILQFGIEGIRGVVTIALELLLLGVDRSCPRRALIISHRRRSTLQLFG